MTTVLAALHRYVAPFAMGMCAAAAASVNDPIAAVGLFGVAGLFGFLSIDAGRRTVGRITGAIS